jgi:nucleotide sugar dehydrogenase
MRVVVIGGGRIGLPMAVTAALSGHQVTVLEQDPARAAAITAAQAPFEEPEMQEGLSKAVAAGDLAASLDISSVSAAQVVLCAIGTGISAEDVPDISGLEAVVAGLGQYLTVGVLVVFKTTLPIGTTATMADRMTQSSGLKLDSELRVCFSPERIVEGKAMQEMRELPKIVGGIGPQSQAAGLEFYSTIGGELVPVSDSQTAELCKLMDNSWRMTRFGFASDVATLARWNGIDAYEAIQAANRDYPRNAIPLPSVGVSGYCLTKDPRYLEAAGREGFATRGFPSTWMAARRAADHHLEQAVTYICSWLEQNSKQGRVVIAGLTYKEDVADTRESHGIELSRMLQEQGCEVVGWDPQLGDCEESGVQVFAEPEPALEGADMVVFTVPHSDFKALSTDVERLVALLSHMRTRAIFDGWGIFRQTPLPPGIHYEGTGLPPSNKG